MRLFIEQSASTAEGRSKPRSMSIDPSDYPNADTAIWHFCCLTRIPTP